MFTDNEVLCAQTVGMINCCPADHPTFRDVAQSAPVILKKIPFSKERSASTIRALRTLLLTLPISADYSHCILPTLEALKHWRFREWEIDYEVRTRIQFIYHYLCRGIKRNHPIATFLTTMCPRIVNRIEAEATYYDTLASDPLSRYLFDMTNDFDNQ